VRVVDACLDLRLVDARPLRVERASLERERPEVRCFLTLLPLREVDFLTLLERLVDFLVFLAAFPLAIDLN